MRPVIHTVTVVHIANDYVLCVCGWKRFALMFACTFFYIFFVAAAAAALFADKNS